MSDDTEIQEPSPAPSLDDVISEFDFGAESQPVQTPAPDQQNYSQQQNNPVKIDPFDENQINQYLNQTLQGQTALQAELQSLSQKLSSYEQRDEQRRVEADIKTAVDTVIKGLDGVDPMMAELYLEKRARESEGFKQIWDNRHTKPAALKKALDAISIEMKDKFLVKADPQLLENQRAMSQPKSSEPATQNSFNEKWDQASQAEKDRLWQQLKSG
jgi:hypothetical protein